MVVVVVVVLWRGCGYDYVVCGGVSVVVLLYCVCVHGWMENAE